MDSQVILARNGTKSVRGGWTLIETAIVITIIALLGLIFWGTHRRMTVELPNAYRAWCKQTGNPKQLTYDEWNDLRKSRPDDNYVPLILPIPY